MAGIAAKLRRARHGRFGLQAGLAKRESFARGRSFADARRATDVVALGYRIGRPPSSGRRSSPGTRACGASRSSSRA